MATEQLLDRSIKKITKFIQITPPEPSEDKLQWFIKACLEFFETTDTNDLFANMVVLVTIEECVDSGLITGDIGHRIRFHAWHVRNALKKGYSSEGRGKIDPKKAIAYFSGLVDSGLFFQQQKALPKKRKAKKQPRQTKIRHEILLDNFQEIVEFHAENGRLPTKNRQSDEIIEFMLACRLEGIQKDPDKIRLIKAKFPTESAIFFEAD